LDSAQGRIFQLVGNLKGEIKPALEQTLEREAARPTGIPLQGEFNQTSGFGPRRNPFGGGYEFHKGLDFIAAYGSPIQVTAPGVVVFSGASGGYGNHVIVDHGYGYQTLYAHLSKLGVVKGAKIDRRQIVGYLGNTGRSTGPHLHYSVFYSGEAVDPKGYLD
jgi:murein DD-endopeptidase MepM/ murein hydrolase activator NlpD